MCVIISGTKKKPNIIELLAAEDQNPDGGGMAWVTRQGVQFRKGLTADEIHEALGRLPETTRWVVHFRFATVGDPEAGLCHPFPIEEGTNLDRRGCVDRALFHNGTVPDWKKRLKDITLDPTFEVSVPGGEWSDSRGVAWLLALNGSIRALHFIEGKFLVINRRGIQIFPQNRTGWTEEDGILYSNTYWRRRIPAIITEMDARPQQEEEQEVLPFLEERQRDYAYARTHGGARSLVDEALDLLNDGDAEAAAMDLAPPQEEAKPKAKRKKKKKTPKRKTRKGLKLRQK